MVGEKFVLLIDFGSTYTKITVVDIENAIIIGTASSYTTVETDINDGLNNALSILDKQINGIKFCEIFACSSAAGGLKMITSGLVQDLTTSAAKQASLGAGAKVLKVFSHYLTKDDLEEIKKANADIILLTGGIDGGNSNCILENSKNIADLDIDIPIVVAGNRSCSEQCKRILEEKGKEVFVCENVLPNFDILNIKPTQECIRKIFLEKIIYAKGLSKALKVLSDIIMPTPSAILRAMNILSLGTETEEGIGELVCVDIGGATTDVYSISDPRPVNPNTIIKGLTEPYSKRTVEGDIGMRYSIKGIVDVVGLKKIAEVSGLDEEKCGDLINLLSENTEMLPNTDELKKLDFALASMSVFISLTRHAGILNEVFTPIGKVFSQEGKDLTKIKKMVVTGGSIIYNENVCEVVKHGFYTLDTPESLKPENANILVDKKYILAAMGLLSQKYPDVAIKIMKKELIPYGN
ncbi:MAG: methylaspartate mutase accessory protein GlmL [Oscillospiraceae bacterium]